MRDEIQIEIYDGFASDFLPLEPQARDEVKALFKILQVNPCDPNVQRRVYLHGQKFEFPLEGGYSIFWKVHHFSILKMKVLVLAIERRRRR
jgi:hypothetical protein